MSQNNSTIVCPVCGSEFELVNNNHVQETSTNFAAVKLALLKEAGVDVSNLFALTDGAGLSKLVSVTDDTVTEIKDSDPIMANIIKTGTVPNHKLFRRWVTSQVFHMLASKEGFMEALQKKGYRYQWKMVVEELRVQAKLSVSDPENLEDRNRWFNKAVVYVMAREYIKQLNHHLCTLIDRPRRCRGRKYIHLRGKNVFIDEVAETVLAPLNKLTDEIMNANTPEEMYTAAKNFYQLLCKTWIKEDLPMNAEFKDAYKGAGAFYTMKNLILFHNCHIHSESGKILSTAGSMKKLHDKAEEYRAAGWKLFGFMKKFIEDNNIDIQAKMAEWRKSN